MIHPFRTFGDLHRISQVATEFMLAGFSEALRKVHLGWYVRMICHVRCTFIKTPPKGTPEKLLLAFERLGPMFMKLGQVLSMRPDLIPKEYVKVFSQLQDRAPAFPFEQVKAIIEKELKKPLTEVFASFSHEPLASASLGQVHRATLSNGESVAVKVQRPGIRKGIKRDLRIMHMLLKKTERHVPELRPMRLGRALDTFTKSLWKELDYEVEGRHADRFAYLFRLDPGVKIPKIYWQETTSRVLTMEFMEGTKMGDREEISKQGLDHKKLMDNCVRACLLPVFKFGFFHADPHPGNVWALKDNRVCYLDFGMMGSVSETLRRNLLLFMYFFIREDVESALYYLLQMSEQNEDADTDGFSEEATNIMVSFLRRKGEEMATMSTSFFQIIVQGVSYRVYFPANLVMLSKALVTGESMCRLTHRQMDYIKESRPIIEKIYAEEFGLSSVISEYQKFAPDLLQVIKQLPKMLRTEANKIGVSKGQGLDS